MNIKIKIRIVRKSKTERTKERDNVFISVNGYKSAYRHRHLLSDFIYTFVRQAMRK